MTIRDSVIRHLADLVAFPTVSSASNLALNEHVSGFAARHGARLRSFPDESGQKASLLISVGPEVEGGLVLSGHTDVVPVEGQDWTSDPFQLTTQGERLVGRGATDMKGFVACCLALLPQIAALPLRKPVHLALSYDEEVGCTGVWSMAEWVGQHLRPALAVIGEPTMMRLVEAHKVSCIGRVRLHGMAGHSSQPDRGVNAVMYAAELIHDIRRAEQELRSGPRLDLFDPPYSTTQVNRIQGGTAGNIIAEDCWFSWEFRMIPGQDHAPCLTRLQALADQLTAQMRQVSGHAGITIEQDALVPGLAPMQDRQLVEMLLTMLGQDHGLGVSYGTEAGIFQRFGTPSCVIGPGTIEDAHRPDESVDIAQLEACCDFLMQLVRRMAL